jgi:hypothetical protein
MAHSLLQSALTLSPMLPRFFAAWLVALVIVPFTAPFSTCDLTSLFGNSHGQHTPVAPLTSVAFTTDAAVPITPYVRSAGRVRLLQISGLALAESAAPLPSLSLMWSAASAGCTRDHSVLRTILRL